jgi:hypothetical protein
MAETIRWCIAGHCDLGHSASSSLIGSTCDQPSSVFSKPLPTRSCGRSHSFSFLDVLIAAAVVVDATKYVDLSVDATSCVLDNDSLESPPCVSTAM